MTAKQAIKDRYLAELKHRFSKPTASELEILDVLAYGCTISKSRTFGGAVMSGSEFAEISRVIDLQTVSALAAKLEAYGSGIKNRCWYVLGMIVREYGSGKIDRRSTSHGYMERKYSAEDLRSTITSLEDLAGIDI